MTRGLPDYYRGVDIAYQALSQMIVRPKYGGALVGAGGAVVTANNTTTLLTVSGKGMIYGGLLFLDSAASQKSGLPGLKTDGNLLSEMSFDTMIKFGVEKNWAYPLYLLRYNEVDFIYSVAAAYGLTFETSFELTYKEQEGATPLVFFDICYALI